MQEKHKYKIYLSPPHLHGKESKALADVLASNWIAPAGPQLDAFEKSLEKYLGVSACLLQSGTAAIHLALKLLEIGQDNEVMVQSFTHIGSVNPILYQQAKPVFIDSELETWNMSPVLLEYAIQDRMKRGKLPKAILPVHLFGMPANMPEINVIASKYDIPVIEDAAEALGSTINGERCGSFGKMGIISFNGNKIITTGGGGALLSKDKYLIEKAFFLATQACDEAPHFQHSHIGYNYRMSNVLAAIGMSQLSVLAQRVQKRHANFKRYQEYFKKLRNNGFDIKLQPEPEGFSSNRWLTTILVDPVKNKGISRESIRLALVKKNIECRPVWKPMHLQPLFSSALFYGEGTSEKLFENGLCLPSGSNLTDEDFEFIFTSLDQIFT